MRTYKEVQEAIHNKDWTRLREAPDGHIPFEAIAHVVSWEMPEDIIKKLQVWTGAQCDMRYHWEKAKQERYHPKIYKRLFLDACERGYPAYQFRINCKCMDCLIMAVKGYVIALRNGYPTAYDLRRMYLQVPSERLQVPLMQLTPDELKLFVN